MSEHCLRMNGDLLMVDHVAVAAAVADVDAFAYADTGGVVDCVVGGVVDVVADDVAAVDLISVFCLQTYAHFA